MRCPVVVQDGVAKLITAATRLHPFLKFLHVSLKVLLSLALGSPYFDRNIAEVLGAVTKEIQMIKVKLVASAPFLALRGRYSRPARLALAG